MLECASRDGATTNLARSGPRSSFQAIVGSIQSFTQGRGEWRSACHLNQAVCGLGLRLPTLDRLIGRASCSRSSGLRFAAIVRNAGAWICLALTFGLAGCDSGDVTVPAACLPGEPPTAAIEPPSAESLSLYLDVSQSLTNFGRADDQSPYRELLAWLLDLRGDFAEAKVMGFADKIAEIDVGTVIQAARGEVGPCASCGFSESRLDEVLDAIADPDARMSLSVVVTDLWLENSGLIGSGRQALQRPLRSILGDGRAIGVLGIAAPYSGQVFDIPSQTGYAAIPAEKVRQRPLFMLLIGPANQITALEERISRELFGDTDPEQRHFSLITPSFARPEASTPILKPRGSGLMRDYVLNIVGTNIPGFRIDHSMAGVGSELTAAIPVTEERIPGPSAYDLETQAWTLFPADPNRACESESWLTLDIQAAFTQAEESGAQSIVLDVSHPDLFGIRPGEIAFVRYELSVASLERGGPSTNWLEAWSFTSEDAPGLLADPPAFFPTLNLKEFGTILEIAMEEHVKGNMIAHGSMLLSVE